jgi:hypothetical protein
MADRTTRRRAAGAAAQPAQQESATGALPPLINVQLATETQSSRSSTEPDNDILPALPDIPNPERLKEITTLKLKDNNFLRSQRKD